MLVAMLDNSEEERYWANIVTTLGMAGDARAVSPLISFLREGTRELSAENLAAKLSVPIALGLLVNRIHSLEAAEYLKASLDPRIWSRRDLGWRNPFDSSTSNRNLELTKVAVLGLGLSGDSTAETALLNLQRQPLTLDLETRAFRAEVKSVVAEALEAFRIIRDGGLSRYYGR
jgi:HEAT repeat protein